MSHEIIQTHADPFELRNLAADPKQAERLAAMRANLDAWMKQQGDQATLIGMPLLLGEPVPLIESGNKADKPKTEGVE